MRRCSLIHYEFFEKCDLGQQLTSEIHWPVYYLEYVNIDIDLELLWLLHQWQGALV